MNGHTNEAIMLQEYMELDEIMTLDNIPEQEYDEAWGSKPKPVSPIRQIQALELEAKMNGNHDRHVALIEARMIIQKYMIEMGLRPK